MLAQNLSTYLLMYFVCAGATGFTVMSDSWAMLARGTAEPRCVDIPRNLTLCRGLEYTSMRLPNLLEQETMYEVTEQAVAWIPLLRLNCHSDTQLFLCSLFAPVCLERLDRPIQPCQSLCLKVKEGCESRMRYHGFPWPEMLHCDKFPLNNDMCIQPRENYENQSCSACNQVSTYENILDNFCRSTHVLKVKVGAIAADHVVVRRGRSVKPNANDKNHLKNMQLFYTADHQSCPCQVAKATDQKPLLVMGGYKNGTNEFVVNMILPWKRDKPFKRAVRMFRKLDCHRLGDEIRDRHRRNHQRKRNREAAHRAATVQKSAHQRKARRLYDLIL